MPTAQSLYMGHRPEDYLAQAKANYDLAMQGNPPPPTPAWFGPAKPQVDEQGRPIPPPMPPMVPPRPSFELTPEQQANITARKQKQAQAQELVTAGRRGQTPSEYRMDIGTASPVDVAATIGAQGAQVHPQVFGPMLAQQRQATEDNARASVLVALLNSYGQAQEVPPEAIVQQALGYALKPGLAEPPELGTTKTVSRETRKKAKEGATTREEYETNLRNQGVSGDVARKEAMREYPEPPGERWGEWQRRAMPNLGSLMAGAIGLLDIMPQPPPNLIDFPFTTEQLRKVETLAREGTPEEQAWARKWLDEYYVLEAQRGKLLGATRGAASDRMKGAMDLLDATRRSTP